MSTVKAVKEPILELPPGFNQALQNKRVVMFLGAGASMEASGPNNTKMPSANALRDVLAQEFFGQKMEGYELQSIADMAILQHGQGIVFEKVRAILEPFRPSAAHKLLPRFHWRRLVTTNYDLLIEQAYAENTQRVQNVVPFVKNSEPIEEMQWNTDRPVLLLKLHGCLNHLHDQNVPLVLSHEHYALHARHRYRLFDRLRDLAHESTIVFCGYRLGDSHIRKIVHDLQEEGVKRPMWYIITPTAIDPEVNYWASLNVQVIRGTFGQFMTALDRSVPEMWRALEPGAGLVEHPIQQHFRIRSDPSRPLRTALGRDLRYIHAAMPVEKQDAGKFYEGYDTGWGAIVHGFDVQRRIVEDLLLEAISDEDGSEPVRFHLLRGPAGSGKSVALKRAAWNAATELDQLVLWLEDGGVLGFDILAELYDLTGKRIILFADRAAERWPVISDILGAAQRKGMLLSVIAAERDNEWNVYGQKLGDGTTPSELRIGQLSTPEIEKLIGLLKTYGALGILQDATFEEQVEAFSQKADRQLLVALHEATRGQPFQEIIFDEYESVVPERARRLYLDICTLHQFGAPVRAGTISRATGVRFDYFRDELLAPLENVVLVEEDKYSGDMAYRSRHAKVAEMVFQQACPDDGAKVERLTRLVEQLDVGYSVDRQTMEQVARGRGLGAMIQTAALGREIYQAILKAEPDQAYIYQQWAIYEMQVTDGSYDEAERVCSIAVGLNPRNRSIAHTYSEIARRRAREENSPLRRDRYRQQARTRLADAGSVHDKLVMSSRCKILVDEVTDLAKTLQGDDDSNSLELAEKVKDAQGSIRNFHRVHGDDPDVLQTEAQLNDAIDRKDLAVASLERAWNANPKGSAVALRLSRAYSGRADSARANAVLRDALVRDPDDKIVHLEMARLSLENGEEVGKALHHLTRSYTRGDANHDARHLHAQLLFMSGSGSDASRLFREVDVAAPATYRAGGGISPTPIAKRLPRYRGRVVRREATYMLLAVPNYPDRLIALQKHTSQNEWAKLVSASEIDFTVGFGRRGPMAMDVKLLNRA